MKYKILSRESNSEWRALPSGYSAFIRGPRAAVHRLLSLPLPLSLLSDNERCSFAPDPFEIRLLLGRCRRTRNEQWITTPLYRMILSNSERGMMHEDTSSCRWLTSTTPTDPIVRNELRSPDTVRCKRAVHITCSLPDAINDISRTRNEPRSFGKFLSLSLPSRVSVWFRPSLLWRCFVERRRRRGVGWSVPRAANRVEVGITLIDRATNQLTSPPVG